MGRKDKIKRNNKKEAAAEKKVQDYNKIINRLLPARDQLKAKAKYIEDTGMLVAFNKNRSLGELEDVWTTDDIKLESIKDQIEEVEKQLRFHCQFVADHWIAKLEKWNDDADKKDPSAGGMGGAGDAMAV